MQPDFGFGVAGWEPGVWSWEGLGLGLGWAPGWAGKRLHLELFSSLGLSRAVQAWGLRKRAAAGVGCGNGCWLWGGCSDWAAGLRESGVGVWGQVGAGFDLCSIFGWSREFKRRHATSVYFFLEGVGLRGLGFKMSSLKTEPD